MKTSKAIKKLLKKDFRKFMVEKKNIILLPDRHLKPEEFDWLHTTFSEYYEIDFLTREEFAIRLIKKTK